MPVIQFIGKTKAKLSNVNILAEKMGQKDTKPATALTLNMSLANYILDQLDPTLRTFLFQKNSNPAKGQGAIEGVAPVSDLPELTKAAVALGGNLDWAYEQTGCTLKIYHGIGAEPKRVLTECKVDAVKFTPREGGSVDFKLNVYCSKDLDAEILGEIAVLHQHDVEIELVGPTVDQQRQLPGSTVTPIKALTQAEKKAQADKETKTGTAGE